jgi:two-component system, NtrC family, sensor kinase
MSPNNESSIFDTNGKIIFSTRTTLLNSKVDFDYAKVFEANEINVQVDRVVPRKGITVSMPIVNKEQCQRCHGTAKVYLGGLYYRPSLDWIVKENDANRKMIFYFVLLTVSITMAVIIVLMHYLLRIPLKDLENTMSEVAQGDLTKRVQVESKDEIGRLGQHFNTMVDRLELANKKLAEVHEAELLRAGKLASLGELAAGLVHEMKNPLSGISAATQVLVEQFEDTDPRREIMQEMIVQVERLNKTLTDLLSFARPRAPQLMPVNVNEVVQNAILLTRSQAEKQKIQIVENYGKNLPFINLDQEQMKQVLLNLILNAFQAMPTGGTLTIETKNVGGQSLDIEIRDTGKGISQENMDKIFTPFFTTRAKGTGLGLPVSKKIVEMHGGEMIVKSELGQGALFTIRLPIEVQSSKSKVR